MRSDDLPLAILALLGFVAVIPALVHYLRGFEALGGTPAAVQFLAAAVVPALLLLFITSWVSPALTRVVTGGFLVVAAMALSPNLWQMAGMGAGRLSGDPLAETLMQVALAVLVLAALVGLGWRRLPAVVRR